MASTNKTPRLGLNQWAAGDEVLRADFNGDNAKIEEQVLLSRPVFGSFLSNGAISRTITLGFKPRFVIAFSGKNAMYCILMIVEDKAVVVGAAGNNVGDCAYTTSQGFVVGRNACVNLDGTCHYLAFH